MGGNLRRRWGRAVIEQRVRKAKFNNVDPTDEVTAPIDNNADYSCEFF